MGVVMDSYCSDEMMNEFLTVKCIQPQHLKTDTRKSSDLTGQT